MRSVIMVSSPLIVFLIHRSLVALFEPTGASTEKARERCISTRLLVGT
jgi:hypothetical protein